MRPLHKNPSFAEAAFARHSGESRNPEQTRIPNRRTTKKNAQMKRQIQKQNPWIPAFAGMTAVRATAFTPLSRGGRGGCFSSREGILRYAASPLLRMRRRGLFQQSPRRPRLTLKIRRLMFALRRSPEHHDRVALHSETHAPAWVFAFPGIYSSNNPVGGAFYSGGRERVRTSDLRLVRAPLFQLSYPPAWVCIPKRRVENSILKGVRLSPGPTRTGF